MAVYLWPTNPPTAERPADSPTRMHRGPTVDPGPLWDSRQWKSRSPGQVWEQTTATPVHLHLPGSQNPALKQSKIPMEKSHWRLQPLYRPNQPSGKNRQSTTHQDCSIWWQQRHHLWPQDESTAHKLKGTVEVLHHTILFLATWTKGLLLLLRSTWWPC